MNHRPWSRVLVVFRTAVVLGLVACGHSHRAGSRPPIPDPQGEFVLQVVNHHWLDVDVFIVHDGLRTRVGTVTATSNDNFILSARLLGTSRQIYLIADAIGSPDVVRTETLVVQPGQYIEWTLETSLSRSSVGVY